MRTLYAIAMLSLCPWLVFADVECTDRPECWPDGSAMHTGLLAEEQLQKVDKELNTTYQRILKSLPPDEEDEYPKRALIAAQRQWVKYRDAECTSISESRGGVRMWKSANTRVCEADMTEKRTQELVKQFEGSGN